MIDPKKIEEDGRYQPSYDPVSHLEVIEGLLEKLGIWMRARDEFEQALDEELVIEYRMESLYLNAAISVAAIGAIAPYIETMVHHEIGYIKYLYADDRPETTHYRVKLEQDEDFWNPSLKAQKKNASSPVLPAKGENIHVGMIQLLDCLNLLSELPASFKEVTDAVFQYRNFALHGGYEWLPEKRKRFSKLIEERKWENWFEWITSNGEPWMACVTKEFVRNAMECGSSLIDVFNRYRDDMRHKAGF